MPKFSQLIMELSFNRKDLIDRLQNLSIPINLHLMKVFLMPNSKYKEHWIEELEAWFGAISLYDLKPSRKMPSKETYYTTLFDQPFGDNMRENAKITCIRMIEKDYPDERLSTTIDDFDMMLEKMKKFYLDMCDILSKNTYDAKSTLKTLIDKYLTR